MHSVINIQGIVDTQKIAVLIDGALILGTVGCRNNGAIGVKLANMGIQCPVNLSAPGRNKEGFFVAGGPHNNAGAVSIPLDQRIQLFKGFTGGFKPACFVHDQQPQFVAGIQIAGGLLIMGSAVAIGTHFFHELNLVAGDVGGYSQTGQTKVLMGADAFDNGLFAVQQQTLVYRDFHCTEADPGSVDINRQAILIQGGFYGI